MEIGIFALVGFVAQLIDGALGMGYGVTVSSFLISLGIPASATSASVHASEIFTSGVSGVFHLRFGNVDIALFRRLVVPGIFGGALGAYALSSISSDTIKPFVAGYLAVMGLVIFIKALRDIRYDKVRTHPGLLGFVGGFLDAMGGGGWGPVVTSTLVAGGNHPRLTIGSANLAEFFVTLAESTVFFVSLGLLYWKIVLGLIVGGVMATPVAALAVRKVSPRALMMLVGGLIVILSVRTIFLTFGK
ncbi:MAG: sulfite exporter TauE/SafE family protein [bacterium JZ-2024 1]